MAKRRREEKPKYEDGKLWWQLTGEACAHAVRDTCVRLERVQSVRRQRARRNLELYEGRSLSGLNPAAYFNENEYATPDFDALRVNFARAVVNTAVAKIAGKQKPKAQFAVTDGEWSIYRKAKKMERFVEAHMLARQDNHHDAWSVGIAAFRDACVTDIGAIKFTANIKQKRIDISRAIPWELLVDPQEARNSAPMNLFHSYAYDRYKLADQFPDYEKEIMAASGLEQEVDAADWYGTGFEKSRQVRVREAWRLPLSDEKPGRHALVIGGVDLCQPYGEEDAPGEEWTRGFFPFEFIVWEPWMLGMYGTSIVDNVYHMVQEINAETQRMSEGQRFATNLMLGCEQGSIPDDVLASNKAVVIVQRKVGSPAVDIQRPEGITQSSIQWWQLMKSNIFEVPGVSQMSATSQIDQGVTAAIAMRTKENIGSERFAVQWEQYERVMGIGAPRQICACARELMEDHPGYMAKWPGIGFFKEFKASDVMLDENQYQIQLAAVSGLVNTPTDRLQLASELFDRQVISKEAFLRITQTKDVDKEISSAGKVNELVDSYIEEWSDATKETEADGKYRYKPPIKFLGIAGLTDMLVQVGRAYLDAELKNAPDFTIAQFVRFMGDCDRIIQQLTAQQAQMQAAAMGKGPAPMPGGDASAGPPPPAGGPAPGPMPPGQVLQ